MKTTSHKKYTLFTAENNFEVFQNELANTFANFKGTNIVLDLSSIKATTDEVTSLESYAEIQIEDNQSFVIVLSNFDADDFEEELNVVPTLIEAEDIIDMDEMTRDLGF